MTEIIERVAKAILLKVPEGYGMTQNEAVDYARAAIEEMRKPSDEMLAAVISEPTHLYPGRPPEYPAKMKAAVAIERLALEQRWQTMIDAALSE